MRPGVGLGPVEGDDHLVQAPEEEVDLGPQQRLAALLGGGPQDQVGQQFGVGPVALRAAGSCAIRCEVCQAASSSRLGCLRIWVVWKTYSLRDEVVEQRLPPVVARLEDLPGQFLDDALDRRRRSPAR